MKAKVLMLILLVVGMLILMPAMVFAGGHHGHHHHDNHGCDGWGYASLGVFLGLGLLGSGQHYSDSYPYYSSYYSPGAVYIDSPPPTPAAERPTDLWQYSPPVKAYKNDLAKKREKELLDKLQQGDDASRMQAIELLAGFSFDDQVRNAMENVLQSDPNAAMRKVVAETFGRVKNQKALGVLETVRVEDTDMEVRQAADRAIDRIKS